MMGAKRFEELPVWLLAKDLAVLIYKMTDGEKLRADFGLKDQLRRCAVSIVSNIAEGYERNGNREFIQFLSFAKGSAGELRAQLHISREIEYISDTQFKELSDKAELISKMIAGFIKFLKDSKLKGAKFVNEDLVTYEVP